MSTLEKTSMLKVLEELTASPHWETPSWPDAVSLAIGEAIFELQGANPVLARRLEIAAAAIAPADCQRQLQAVLEAAGMDAQSANITSDRAAEPDSRDDSGRGSEFELPAIVLPGASLNRIPRRWARAKRA